MATTRITMRLLEVARELEEDQALRQDRYDAQFRALEERLAHAEHEKAEMQLLTVWVRKERDQLKEDNGHLSRALESRVAEVQRLKLAQTHELGEFASADALTLARELVQTRFALAALLDATAAARAPGGEPLQPALKENAPPAAAESYLSFSAAKPPPSAPLLASELRGVVGTRGVAELLAAASSGDATAVLGILAPVPMLTRATASARARKPRGAREPWRSPDGCSSASSEGASTPSGASDAGASPSPSPPPSSDEVAAGAALEGLPTLEQTLNAALLRILLHARAAPGAELPPPLADCVAALLGLGASASAPVDGAGLDALAAVAASDGAARAPALGARSSLLHALVAAGAREAALVGALRAGARVDALDGAGRTPLHVAALHARPVATEVLLRNGASLLLRDSEGLTAEQLAARAHADETARAAATASGDAPPATSSAQEAGVGRDRADGAAGGAGDAAPSKPGLADVREGAPASLAAARASVAAVFADGSLVFWSLVRSANSLYKEAHYSAARDAYAEILARAAAGSLSSLQIERSNMATIHYNWARAAFKDGLHLEALEQCELALEQQPGYPNALIQRAQCHMELLDFERATAAYDALCRLAEGPEPPPGGASAAEWAELRERARALRDADPCDVLELDPAALLAPADESAIKRAYRAQCLRWHPDKHTASAEDSARANHMFRRLSDAFELLSDERKREGFLQARREREASSSAADARRAPWPYATAGAAGAGAYGGAGSPAGRPARSAPRSHTPPGARAAYAQARYSWQRGGSDDDEPAPPPHAQPGPDVFASPRVPRTQPNSSNVPWATPPSGAQRRAGRAGASASAASGSAFAYGGGGADAGSGASSARRAEAGAAGERSWGAPPSAEKPRRWADYQFSGRATAASGAPTSTPPPAHN